MTLALLLAFLLQAVPSKETVTVLGTKVSFDLVSLPGDGKVRPFAIGAREVSWAEIRCYTQTEPKGVDAVARFLDGLGIAAGKYKLLNGSGLYDADRFSPSQLVDLLRAVYHDFRFAADGFERKLMVDYAPLKKR